MNRTMFCALAATVVALGGVARAQPSELAHDEAMLADARAVHERAVRDGDKAAILKSDAQIQAFEDDVANDRKDAALQIPEQDRGLLRDSDAELIRAKEAHQRALATGDAARIALTEHDLKLAYERHWTLTHEAQNAHR